MKSDVVEILLVEDNEYDAELTIRALKKANVVNGLKWLKDGEEALEYIFGDENNVKTSMKLILLDLKMPKVDGLEVAKRLKSDNRTKFMPVVILTSSEDEVDRIKAYEFGVNSYIIKPVDFEKFFDAVQKVGLYWLLFNKTPEV
ncbi:response regulator [Calditerrivibrio nitroreducens]|uniref:Response regulator receiver protein n=1 Tax=Calditerrivibrio nitroreducens (strain DSM 19672 / NBRC 101217 / Yu37-1) TaxID=768670 RepID=E4TGU5_CALNY|nr:response regulator [Calditerrivibrio nitroreducens]ADR18705.1 response regulator receiver protein [Calditerrivibrio nitroreducens DSM 19672]